MQFVCSLMSCVSSPLGRPESVQLHLLFTLVSSRRNLLPSCRNSFNISDDIDFVLGFCRASVFVCWCEWEYFTCIRITNLRRRHILNQSNAFLSLITNVGTSRCLSLPALAAGACHPVSATLLSCCLRERRSGCRVASLSLAAMKEITCDLLLLNLRNFVSQLLMYILKGLQPSGLLPTFH